MFESVLLSVVLLVAVGVMAANKRRDTAHNDIVSQIKSEIASKTRMTAKIAIFSDGKLTTVIMAASEELSTFFHYKVSKSEVVERNLLNLEKIIQTKLYINGQNVHIGTPKAGAIPTAFAHETCMSDLAMSEIGRLTALRSISIDMIYQGDSFEKNITLNIIGSSDDSAKQRLNKIIENAIWWGAFLHAASIVAKKAAAEQAARLAMDPTGILSSDEDGTENMEQEAQQAPIDDSANQDNPWSAFSSQAQAEENTASSDAAQGQEADDIQAAEQQTTDTAVDPATGMPLAVEPMPQNEPETQPVPGQERDAATPQTEYAQETDPDQPEQQTQTEQAEQQARPEQAEQQMRLSPATPLGRI